MQRNRFSRDVVLALGVAAAFGVNAYAASATNPLDPDKIHLEGCPVQMNESCLLLLDKRGTPYDVSAAPARSEPAGSRRAPPRIARHRALMLDGTVAEGEIGACRRGVVLKDIRWTYTTHKCSGSPPSKK